MSYFNKEFFYVSSGLMLLPFLIHAQVASIVFTTDSQTIKPNEISGVITVQLQDVSGNSYKSTETVDVEFLSSSGTGEFLSPTSESVVTKTISTGSANKNFRYRDSTEGTFIMSINAKGRSSGILWNTNQNIIISSALPANTATSTTTTTTTDTSTSNTSNQTVAPTTSATASSHYSSMPLTAVKPDTKFVIGAGRDRLGTVGTPMEFKAESNKESMRGTAFKWTFGDGAVGYGESITHSYFYPGEYVVVLNVSGPEGQAVSRTNVKIVPAALVISLASAERIEIANNSGIESNLFGRAIVSGDKVFFFPQDTIIKAGHRISFDSNVTGLAPLGISDAFLMVVGAEARPQQITAKIAEHREAQISFIQTRISELRRELAVMSGKERPQESSLPPIAPEGVVAEPQAQIALALDAIPEAGSNRWGSWLETIKRFFLGTR